MKWRRRFRPMFSVSIVLAAMLTFVFGSIYYYRHPAHDSLAPPGVSQVLMPSASPGASQAATPLAPAGASAANDDKITLPPWLDRIKRLVVAGLEALKFFTLRVDAQQIQTFYGLIAAILGVIATSGAVVIAFAGRLNRWRERLCVFLEPANDVFIGGGRTATGIAIARDRALCERASQTPGLPRNGIWSALTRFIGMQARLIALDVQARPLLAEAMEHFRTRAFLHPGDALLEKDTAAFRLHRATVIWITTGQDERNIKIAHTVLRRIRARRKTTGAGTDAPRILVEVDKRALRLASDTILANECADLLPIEHFSMMRLAARVLLRESLDKAAGQNPARHVLVVGTSPLARAIVLHAVQHLVVGPDPADCVHITIAGHRARAMLADLQREYLALAPSSDDQSLRPLLPLARLSAINCDESSLSLLAWDGAQISRPFDQVLIACDNDLQGVTAASHAATLRELNRRDRETLRIRLCLQTPEFAESVDSGSTKATAIQIKDLEKIGVELFRVFEQCLDPADHYPGEQHDKHAILVRAAYRSTCELSTLCETDLDATLAGALQSWREKPDEVFRWSDRLAADHIGIKRALATGKFANNVPVPNPSELEHRRYVVERLVDGWLPCQVDARLLEMNSPNAHARDEIKAHERLLRINPTLIPYADLKRLKGTDFQAIDARIAELCEAANTDDTDSGKTSGLLKRLEERLEACMQDNPGDGAIPDRPAEPRHIV